VPRHRRSLPIHESRDDADEHPDEPGAAAAAAAADGGGGGADGAGSGVLVERLEAEMNKRDGSRQRGEGEGVDNGDDGDNNGDNDGGGGGGSNPATPSRPPASSSPPSSSAPTPTTLTPSASSAALAAKALPSKSPRASPARKRILQSMVDKQQQAQQQQQQQAQQQAQQVAKGSGGEIGSYDTRSILDHPPSPPAPPPSNNGAAAVTATANGRDAVASLNAMLGDVDLDDICADPPAILFDAGHDDDSSDDEDEGSKKRKKKLDALAAAVVGAGGSDVDGDVDGGYAGEEDGDVPEGWNAFPSGEFDNVAASASGGDAANGQNDGDAAVAQGDDDASTDHMGRNGGVDESKEALFGSDPFASTGTNTSAVFVPANEDGDEEAVYREEDDELGTNLLSRGSSRTDPPAGAESQADRIRRYKRYAEASPSSDEDDSSDKDEGDDGDDSSDEEAGEQNREFQTLDDDEGLEEDGRDVAESDVAVRVTADQVATLLPAALGAKAAAAAAAASASGAADPPSEAGSSYAPSSVPPPPPPRDVNRLVTNLLANKRPPIGGRKVEVEGIELHLASDGIPVDRGDQPSVISNLTGPQHPGVPTDATVTSAATGVTSVGSSRLAGVHVLPDGSVAPGGGAASTSGDTFDRSVDTATVATLESTAYFKPKETKAIPLIKPPPDDKMKAWAASKGLIPNAAVIGANPEAEQALQRAEKALEEAKKLGLGEEGSSLDIEDTRAPGGTGRMLPADFAAKAGITLSTPTSADLVPSSTDGDTTATALDTAQDKTSVTTPDDIGVGPSSGVPETTTAPDGAKAHTAYTYASFEPGKEAQEVSRPVEANSDDGLAVPKPAEGEQDEHRARLAAKFASASSAAAQAFESRYEKTSHNSSGSLVAQSSAPNDLEEKPTARSATPTLGLDLLCGTESASLADGFACGSSPKKPDMSALSAALGNRQPGAFEVADLNPSSSGDDQRGLDLHGGAFNSWVKEYDSPRKASKDELISGGIGSEEVKAATSAAAAVISSNDTATGTKHAGGDKTSPRRTRKVEDPTAAVLLSWVKDDIILGSNNDVVESSMYIHKDMDDTEASQELRALLGSNVVFNKLCEHVVESTNDKLAEGVGEKEEIECFRLNQGHDALEQSASFVSFLSLIASSLDLVSPYGEENPFASLRPDQSVTTKTMQELIFNDDPRRTFSVISFLYSACRISQTGDRYFDEEDKGNAPLTPRKSSPVNADDVDPADTVKRRNAQGSPMATALRPSSLTPMTLFSQGENKNLIVPKQGPSPFERAVSTTPEILVKILAPLGDPATVCRIKAVNRECRRIITSNEHSVMKEAVRHGGLDMHLRPSFWMWITLEKGQRPRTEDGDEASGDFDLADLATKGEEGRWHHTITRDVTRSFGNMPPHKTGARLKRDSIVRALVFYGQGRLIKRGVKGGIDQYPRDPKLPPSNNSTPGRAAKNRGGDEDDSIGSDQSPTDTVSDWGGISPVGSTVSASNSRTDTDVSALNDSRLSIGPIVQNQSMQSSVANSVEVEDIALCPRDLTNEVKEDLQSKLGFILHALAASNETVGYCQGMDYIVAHLLRILPETVLYRAVKGTLPPVIKSKLRKNGSSMPSARPPSPARAGSSAALVSALEIDESSLVVEETVYRVMHAMLTTYGLQHMYWPELRCLKTCCKVFERLIEIKLPVLADHFDHHGLNVGIFALGWFQTLFLYLPSMPTATVCHIWDIWLVERSFKIFFRVGTAILFLSQPILLNHELEGMMTYLNTFPDATLLNPDILLACALQIKVTNKMLEDIEREVTGQAPMTTAVSDEDVERKAACSPCR